MYTLVVKLDVTLFYIYCINVIHMYFILFHAMVLALVVLRATVQLCTRGTVVKLDVVLFSLFICINIAY